MLSKLLISYLHDKKGRKMRIGKRDFTDCSPLKKLLQADPRSKQKTIKKLQEGVAQ